MSPCRWAPTGWWRGRWVHWLHTGRWVRGRRFHPASMQTAFPCGTGASALWGGSGDRSQPLCAWLGSLGLAAVWVSVGNCDCSFPACSQSPSQGAFPPKVLFVVRSLFPPLPSLWEFPAVYCYVAAPSYVLDFSICGVFCRKQPAAFVLTTGLGNVVCFFQAHGIFDKMP